MSEDEKKNPENWELAICPLRNKQCLRQQCMWWLEESRECAVTKIAREVKL